MSDYKIDEWVSAYLNEDETSYVIPTYKIDRLRGVEQENTNLKSRIKQLEEREKILRECVEFYACSENWIGVDSNAYRTVFKAINEVDVDDRQNYFKRVCGGKKARETLSKLEELK